MPRWKLKDQAVQAADGVWIAPGAQVIGDVALGANASIWFNAVVRADNETMRIGANTNIQDGAVLHADPGFPLTVGEGVTVGHQAMLHGCTVGDGSLIGMGAVVLNGAVIGKHCLVAAGAVVTEGKVFEDKCLIAGAPAVAKRVLSDEAIAKLQSSAMHYVKNAQRYVAELQCME